MKRRGSFTFGVILILLGAWFLALQFVPQLQDWINQFSDWPVWVMAPGVIFLLAALISGVYDLVIPGSILSGIGLILYYQNETGDWQSWAYAWALIIVFVGIGVFIANLLKGRFREAFNEGGPPIMTGVVMFLIFGSIFRAMFGQSPLLGDYWPLLLVFVGLWMLIKPLFRRNKRGPRVTVTVDGEPEAFDHVVEDVEDDWEATLDASFDDED